MCTELLVSRCSASSPRLNQQQTHTSSLAPGRPTQADSVQNCPLNVQESVNTPATIPQKSSSHVPTFAMSPLSQSESSINKFSLSFYLFLSALLISVNVLSVSPLLQFRMNYLPLSGSQTNYGTFASKNFRSRERKYHGMELSLPGTFDPWNFRSLERKFLELSLPGTFASLYFRSRERKFQELSLPRQVTFGHKRRLHGGDRPHGQKVVGGDALKLLLSPSKVTASRIYLN